MKSRIWEKNKGKYAGSRQDSDHTAIFVKQDMRRSFTESFEICMESHAGHQHGGWTETSVSLLQKREFISRGTQKYQNNTFSN